MKLTKTTSRVLSGFLCLTFLSGLNNISLAVSGGEEEGGIAGTGYKDRDQGVLRPDLPDRGIRPESIQVPARPEIPTIRESRPDTMDAINMELPNDSVNKPEN